MRIGKIWISDKTKQNINNYSIEIFWLFKFKVTTSDIKTNVAKSVCKDEHYHTCPHVNIYDIIYREKWSRTCFEIS